MSLHNLANRADDDLHNAWEAHRALLLAEARNPSLADNPHWRLHRMDAYEAFHNMLTRYCDGR